MYNTAKPLQRLLKHPGNFFEGFEWHLFYFQCRKLRIDVFLGPDPSFFSLIFSIFCEPDLKLNLDMDADPGLDGLVPPYWSQSVKKRNVGIFVSASIENSKRWLLASDQQSHTFWFRYPTPTPKKFFFRIRFQLRSRK